MLSKKNQLQKATYGMISFIWNVQNRQIHRDSDWLSRAGDSQRRRAEGGMENDC